MKQSDQMRRNWSKNELHSKREAGFENLQLSLDELVNELREVGEGHIPVTANKHILLDLNSKETLNREFMIRRKLDYGKLPDIPRFAGLIPLLNY